jgi:hypothetical protein
MTKLVWKFPLTACVWTNDFSCPGRWDDGHCTYGESCKYAHGEAELRANIAAAQFEGMAGAGAWPTSVPVATVQPWYA